MSERRYVSRYDPLCRFGMKFSHDLNLALIQNKCAFLFKHYGIFLLWDADKPHLLFIHRLN